MVDGFYDRGKTKHNIEKARAVVDEIVRRLSDPDLYNNPNSNGNDTCADSCGINETGNLLDAGRLTAAAREAGADTAVAAERHGIFASGLPAGPITKDLNQKIAAACAAPVSLCQSYIVTQLEYEAMSLDEFYAYAIVPKIKEKILQVINCEGPVSKNLLCKRVLQSFGIGRMGSNVAARMDELIGQIRPLETRQGEKTFYWPGNLETKTITVYRVSANEAERRSIEEIPPEEIACAVKAVLTHQIGLPHTELVRETARLLGFQRIVKGVESTIALGIECAIERGWAGVDRSGNVVLG